MHANKQTMLALTKPYMPTSSIGTAHLFMHQHSPGQLHMPLNTSVRCLIPAGSNWSLSQITRDPVFTPTLQAPKTPQVTKTLKQCNNVRIGKKTVTRSRLLQHVKPTNRAFELCIGREENTFIVLRTITSTYLLHLK